MALRLVDSFDDRTTANINFKLLSSNVPGVIGTAYGRNGAGYFSNAGTGQWLDYALDSGQDTWIIGLAYRTDGASLLTGNPIYFFDAAQSQCYISFGNDGKIRFYRADDTLLFTTSTAPLLAATWQFIEFKVKFSNTVGTFEVRVNGVSIGSATGLDNCISANNYATIFRLRGSINYYVDDLYICDGSGGDDFRGDCKVECLRPSGAGNYAQFTPSAGSNYQNVDDPFASAPCPDGDSTYNVSSGVGNKDSFVFENLATTAGTIEGIQIGINARKTDAGSRTLRTFVRQSSTDYEGSDKSVLDSYSALLQVHESNPSTAVAWTITDINTNAEFGYKDQA